MSIRRLATLCILLSLNLLLGFMYIQPSKIKTYISSSTINETELLVDSTMMSSFLDKSAINISKENFQTTTTQPYPAERTLPLYYNFTLNPRDLCSKNSKNKSKLSLLILVCTAIPNIRHRQVIRETWGSVAGNNTGNVRLGFLLGSTNNSALQEQLEEEFYEHGDIIQQNFIDSYQNLTLKSIMLLKWVSDHCSNVQYILKTDDDMYVNVANLVNLLIRLPLKSNVMYGVLFKKAKPNRNPSAKWYVPKNQFDGTVFPDYLSGTGYAMSRDVVPKLLEASAVLSFLVMEDVFITGLCASESHVKRVNVKGFAYWRRMPTGCAFKDVATGHHVSISEMRKIWRELQKRPLICRQQKKKL